MELEMALKEASAIRRVDICIIFDSTCLPISEKIDLSSFQPLSWLHQSAIPCR